MKVLPSKEMVIPMAVVALAVILAVGYYNKRRTVAAPK